jgi:putative Mg2+ transporter-C (MgtC) family protein
LNTAATLWCAAAIGVLCGAGRVTFAAAGTGILLVAQVALFYVSQRLHFRNGMGEPIEMSANLEWNSAAVNAETRKKWISYLRDEMGVRVQSVRVKKSSDGVSLTAQVTLWKMSTEELDEWVQKLELKFGGQINWETV